MKCSPLLTIALALSAKADTFLKGFNLPAQKPDGTCKTQEDWKRDFLAMQGLPGVFPNARLFASSDCSTLANAVPAAIATKTRLLVGIWTEDWDHFGAEKYALLTAIKQYGSDWILACSVGSEDLYRAETAPNTLAGQIYDVRGMLGTVSKGIPVGHVDTWTAWVNPANDNVTKACDFIGTDGYPYWQGSTITNAYNVLYESVQVVKDRVATVSPGKPVWVTETGWPVSGANFGASVSSKANAQAYWSAVGCSVVRQYNTFWYTLQDYASSPSFGVLDANGKALYNLKCLSLFRFPGSREENVMGDACREA